MAFVVLERSDIFLKEILKLLFGKETVNHFKDHRFFFGF